MDDPVSHLHLLATARTLEYAAMRDDLPTLHRELCRLRNDLSRHLVGEAPTLARLAPVPREVVTKGQHRLRALVDELLADSAIGPNGECACVARVAEIVASLARQARLECGLLVRREIG